jgi:hypothetical protein
LFAILLAPIARFLSPTLARRSRLLTSHKWFRNRTKTYATLSHPIFSRPNFPPSFPEGERTMKIAYLLPLVVALAFGFVLSSNVATAFDGPIDSEYDRGIGQTTVQGSCHTSNPYHKQVAEDKAYKELDKYNVKEILEEGGSTQLNMYVYRIKFTYYK